MQSASCRPSLPSPGLAEWFLRRLARLVQIRTSWAGRLSSQEECLLGKAIYSTYMDCLALGRGPEARSILAVPGHDDAAGPPRPLGIDDRT
jgi:hypothetical protein